MKDEARHARGRKPAETVSRRKRPSSSSTTAWPSGASGRLTWKVPRYQLAWPSPDGACFQARLADHEAFDANRRGDSARALALYRALPAEDVHPFASYRRDAGLAFGLHRQGARDEALGMARRACEHAGDGGYVRLRVMGLLMIARIQGAPDHASTLARAAAIAKRLEDPELWVRVERARGRAHVPPLPGGNLTP